ncbi:MAG: H-X9-DG-CTERM domain-containing protein [Phycisphaerae bacterium]
MPFGFRVQSMVNPEDLWEGFFCPAQKLRNTTDPRSGELDPADSHESYPTAYKYASGYMVNRILRSAVTKSRGQGVRWSREPSDQFEALFGPQGYDNIFGWAVVRVDVGRGPRNYHIQATSTDELTNPAEIMYMCDSLDYHLEPPVGSSLPYQGTGNWTSGSEQSAGLWYIPYGAVGVEGVSDPWHVVLGARHNGKANVLYGDSHVSRDNQVVRDRRGSMPTASTFADFTEDRAMGNQFHIMPPWRRFGQR